MTYYLVWWIDIEDGPDPDDALMGCFLTKQGADDYLKELKDKVGAHCNIYTSDLLVNADGVAL
jgi:hypothetical protein